MDTQKDPEMYGTYTPALPYLPRPIYVNINTYIHTYILIGICLQHLRQDDCRADRLLGHLHALRPRRPAQELPAVRVPRHQLLRAGHAGVPLSEVLAVCSALPSSWGDAFMCI